MSAPVWFYGLADGDPIVAAPPLVARAHEAGGGVLVVLPDAASAARLDDVLWTFKDDSFLPHGLDGAPFAGRQPVLLTADPSRPTDAAFVIRVAAAPWAGQGAALRRVMVLFDADDPTQSARAADAKRHAVSAGAAVEHWRQEGAGWRRASGT